MLGLCIVVALAVAAMAASSASAFKEPNVGWAQYKNCPYNALVEEITVRKCTVGVTRSGAGGSYTVGGITVNITRSIKLQGALSKPKPAGSGELEAFGVVVPPETAPAIVPVKEPVPGAPLANISSAEQEEFGWPDGLKKSYKVAQKMGWVGEGKISEEIEPAGQDTQYVSENHIAEDIGTGIKASVQIQGVNLWTEVLGGNCVIGSEANPIVQNLTDGESESPLTHEKITGAGGELTLGHEGSTLSLSGIELVDNTYAVPGAEHCGGPAYEKYLDPVVNRAFGIPAAAGASTTRLIGELDASSALATKLHFEK